jgi:flagellar basal-body rod modification protein FlgD
MAEVSLQGVTSYTDPNSQVSSYGQEELNEESFLKLLVTQLQNQDPLEPQNSDQFISQLAQFSSLEQLTSANDSLESLYMAMASMNNASMTQLIGQSVVAYGDTFHYDGGTETVGYESATNSEATTVTITDEEGNVVWTESLGQVAAGEGSYSWDGETFDGTASEGNYTITISGTDSSGNPVEFATTVEGVIDGMSFEEGTPVPTMDGVQIQISDIIEVRASEEDQNS